MDDEVVDDAVEEGRAVDVGVGSVGGLPEDGGNGNSVLNACCC